MAADPPPADPSPDDLRARAEAAEAALDALAGALAHDLRAPVRAIDGFSQILLAPRHADGLPDDTRRFLGLLRDAGADLAGRLDDLVDLVRTARAPLARRDVDPGALARELVDAVLAPRAPDVAWTIAPGLPRCRADRAQLRRLLEELLDNAARSGARRVELAWDGGRDAYAVRDDGRGFDGELPERALALFGRLPGADAHDGTGAGLALAAQIAARHGGRIWGRGTPGAGATLWFTIGEDAGR
jgi:two-component system sensor kinase